MIKEDIGRLNTHQSNRLVDRKGGELSEERKSCVQTDGLLLLLLFSIPVAAWRLPLAIHGRDRRLLGGDGDVAFLRIDEE